MNNPTLALAIEFLAIVGLGALLDAAIARLRERFSLDCNPLRVPPGAPGAVAVVQPESDGPEDDGTPLWVARESLTPVPSGAAVPAQDGGLA